MGSRRRFISSTAAAVAASRFPRAAAAADAPIPKRPLGQTGAMVSIVGMGGFHIGKPQLSDADAVALVHAGIDRGINFMDNCWDYNEGVSEVRLGKALAQGGYRDRVFLMTKVDGRTKSSATLQLDQSLKRLQTDHLDLWQFHENIRPDDADRIFAPGGAFEAAMAAKQAGKIRHLGFTGHKSPEYHLHMFDVAAQHGFTFDTVQMPLNVMDAHFQSFEKNVIPVAQRHGTAILAMKTFGDDFIVATKALSPIQMLHYGMNLPVATVITGIDSKTILDQAVLAATTFVPLTKDQVAAMLAQTAILAEDGKTEMYKTSHHFDGTYMHPEWLG
jgi:diketogulonate reductase-like aldo/keto reductase